MHLLSRSGSLFLVLGVALSGCSKVGEAPVSNRTLSPAAPGNSSSTVGNVVANATDYVLTVEGMH